AAYFPAGDEVGVGAQGAGWLWNGKQARVSGVSRLSEAVVLTTDAWMGTPAQVEALEGLCARAGLVRTWGDCYGYLLVATGRAEGMTDALIAPWDAAALQPIIEEA